MLGIEPKNLHAKVLKCQIMFFGIGIKKNQKLGIGPLVSELKNCSNENPFSLHIRYLLADFYYSIMKPRKRIGNPSYDERFSPGESVHHSLDFLPILAP